MPSSVQPPSSSDDLSVAWFESLFLFWIYTLCTLPLHFFFLQWIWLCRPLLWVWHIAPQLSSLEEASWISCHWRHHLWCGNVGFPVMSCIFLTLDNIPIFLTITNVDVLVFVVFRPIMHHSVRYNCRVLFLNRLISIVTCYSYGLAGLNFS